MADSFTRFKYYSHDLFVSLIEAGYDEDQGAYIAELFSRSIREPH